MGDLIGTVILVLLGLTAKTANAWSGDAHRAVAHIAANHLNFKGGHYVAEHLGGKVEFQSLAKTMMEASLFADTIEWSEPLHFAHTPKEACAEFNMATDCPHERCIVTGIGNYTVRAASVDLSREQRAEAIKFLIHLMADIHNPMHVGFASDFGGNSIWLTHPPLDEEGRQEVIGGKQNLHHVWDYELVKRKQIELSVFTEENGNLIRQPWKLSEALLLEIPLTRAEKARANLLLKVDADDIQSEQASRILASRIASETSQVYTCAYAYQRKIDDWIRRGEALGDEYLNDRADVAMELLKKAGIRLAEILNTIAFVYFGRTSGRKARKHLQINKRIDGSLYFAADFDPDYLIEDSDEVSPHEPILQDVDWLDELPFVPSLKGSKVGVDSARRRAQTKSGKIKKKKNLTRNDSKENEERDIFQDVDLNQVILVEREGNFVIIGKQNKWQRTLPLIYFKYSVRFDGNLSAEPVIILVDGKLVNSKFPSDALVSRMLLKIRKIDEASFLASSAPALTRTGFEFKPSYRREGLIPNNYVAPTVEVNPRPPQSQIYFFHSGQVELFILRETLMSGDAIIRTSRYHCEDEDSHIILRLIDEKLFSGPLTEAIMASLMRVQRPGIGKAMMKKHRPSLLDELAELGLWYHGTDFLRGYQITTIKWFIEIPSDFVGFRRLHWSIEDDHRHGQPPLDIQPVAVPKYEIESEISELPAKCLKLQFFLGALISAILALTLYAKLTQS